jgi:hypothetical protein
MDLAPQTLAPLGRNKATVVARMDDNLRAEVNRAIQYRNNREPRIRRSISS